MQSLVSSVQPDTLPESQRTALISLLVDEDPAIYEIVRRNILSYGQQACRWLRPHLLSSDPVMRRRSLEIVHYLARQNCDERFLAFCLNNGEELDLETAVGLLAQTQYPDTNVQAYQALYDIWAAELRDRIDFAAQPEQLLGVINRYLFEELGFSGNENYTDNPENCYLNRVVDRRTGVRSACARFISFWRAACNCLLRGSVCLAISSADFSPAPKKCISTCSVEAASGARPIASSI